MISRGVEISIAGGGGEMVRACITLPKDPSHIPCVQHSVGGRAAMYLVL